MTKTIVYRTRGTCSREITVTLEDDRVESVSFVGGCHGNLQGISALVRGRKIEELIPLLSGINCGGKGTSCPDQLAKALMEAQKAGKDPAEGDKDGAH